MIDIHQAVVEPQIVVSGWSALVLILGFIVGLIHTIRLFLQPVVAKDDV